MERGKRENIIVNDCKSHKITKFATKYKEGEITKTNLFTQVWIGAVGVSGKL